MTEKELLSWIRDWILEERYNHQVEGDMILQEINKILEDGE
jgi:hypothetical protein